MQADPPILIYATKVISPRNKLLYHCLTAPDGNCLKDIYPQKTKRYLHQNSQK